MWRATISSLLAHKLRLAMTALAVVLGVAFVTGTLVYTDTVRSSFDSVFGNATANIDYSVRGVSRLADVGDGGDNFAAAPRPVTPEIADRIAALGGVAAVERNVEGVAQVLDRDGETIGTQGPPAIGFNAPTVDELSTLQLRSGRYPTAGDEVALDASTARRNGFAVDDTVQVAANGPVASYELVGTFGFSDDVDNMAGASITLFHPDTAFELFNVDGGYANVDVFAAGDADPADLRDRLSAAAGHEYEIVTSDELAAEAQQSVDGILGAFSTALLVFAGVSLLVGAFIIANTFTMIVAQRTRELALLRAVGASRRQVLASVLFEALLVGLVASLVGAGLGALVAMGLHSLLTAFGLELPATDLVFTVRSLLVGFGVGVGVTVLSALPPAVKALRVPPVAAMQAVAAPPVRRNGRMRTAFGLMVSAAGLGLLGVGLFAGGGFPVVVSGGVALLLGAALLARHITRPLLRVVGLPVARLGIRGALAHENAMRSPQRTASTASALMIGLGLVTFALIFGASLRASATRTIDEQFASDLQIRSQSFQPIARDVPGLLEDLPQVGTVTDMRLAQVGIDERVTTASVVEPDKLTSVWSLEVTDGALEDFGEGGVVVSNDAAEDLGVSAGDTLAVTFPRTGEQQLVVRAIVDSETASYYIDEATFLDNATDEGPFTLYLALAEGVTVAEGHAAVSDVTAEYAGLNVQDSVEMREEIAGQVNQILGLMTALLGLSVLIALFGIANTLSLSVFERVRELGLLRAVGATRDQVRAVIRWEAVLIAVLGAVFGIVVGTVFGWMTVRALAQDGVSVFAFPTVQVLVGVIAAAVAGMLAAVVPARRASRVDILRALAA